MRLMLATLKHLFTPHHTNNHRPRILQPLGMLVMVGLILSGSGAVEVLEHRPVNQGLVLGYASNITISQVLEQTNQERINNGLNPLELNEALSKAAANKAADMFSKDYWAHVSPDGVPPWTFIRNAGYRYSVAGENLARDFDTTGPMVAAWMASPTHRDNIVHNRYTQTGIAVANGQLGGVETTLVVQMFGEPVGVVVAANRPSGQIADQGSTQPAIEETIDPIEVVTLPEESVVVAETPTVAVLSQSEGTSQTPVYVSPLDIKKSIVLAVILLMMAVLVVDEMIIRHRQTARFVGRNLAHFSFLLLFMMIVINIIQPGTIR